MCRVAVIGTRSIRILSEHVLRTGVGTMQASIVVGKYVQSSMCNPDADNVMTSAQSPV